jgi:hypothetical protein
VQSINPQDSCDGYFYTKDVLRTAEYSPVDHRAFLDDRSPSSCKLDALEARAWAATQVASRNERLIEAAHRINTSGIPEEAGSEILVHGNRG